MCATTPSVSTPRGRLAHVTQRTTHDYEIQIILEVAGRQGLSMEYRRYGIRVNTVALGGTEVPARITLRLAIIPEVMAELFPSSAFECLIQRCQEHSRAKRLLHESRHALTGKALVHLILAIAAHHNDAHVRP